MTQDMGYDYEGLSFGQGMWKSLTAEVEKQIAEILFFIFNNF